MDEKAVHHMCRPGLCSSELQPGMGGVEEPEQDKDLERKDGMHGSAWREGFSPA